VTVELPAVIRWLDLVLLAAALPVFVLADLPLAGYLAAAGAWVVQRAIQVGVQRRIAATEDPRAIVGMSAGSMIARGWIAAGSVFAVGLAAGDEDGLAAAVLVLFLFTVYLSVQLMLRPLGPEGGRR
jgi:hypothetical protein